MSPADFDLLAAEHVMGLLEGEEARTAEKLLAQDAEFAVRVAFWRERFSAFDDSAPKLPPGDGLWAKIESALPNMAKTPEATLGAAGKAAGLWDNLQFWRTAGLAAAAAAVALGLALGVAVREAARQPVMIAVMLNDANRAAAIVNVLADGSAELVPLDDVAAPPGRTMQIWTLWDRARGPVSLGVVGRTQRMKLQLGNLPKTAVDQIFEITLEPEGGSTAGRPTGPVLMKGAVSTAL